MPIRGLMNFFRLLCMAAMTLAVSACGTGIPFQADPKVPNAEGTVETMAGATGNMKLSISVHGLPPPSEASSGANAYVVWVVQAQGGDPQRLGALTFDAHLVGKLETETAFHNFRLFISPEESETPQTPLGPHVMNTTVDR